MQLKDSQGELVLPQQSILFPSWIVQTELSDRLSCSSKGITGDLQASGGTWHMMLTCIAVWP